MIGRNTKPIKKAWRPRLPETAAVLLSVSGEAMEAATIAEAQSKVNFDSLEIPILRPKRITNGSLLLEIG